MTPYYERGGITIYCGDCLEIMPGLDGPFDAIIADLPYGTTACEWDSVIPLEPLWAEYRRLIKRRGAIVLTASQPFTTDLINAARDWFKYEWIWDKRSPVDFLNVKIKPMSQHEEILIFCGSRPTYNPQYRDDVIKKPQQGVRVNGKQNRVYGQSNNIRNFGVGYPKTILSFPRPTTNKQHPTQKPVALMSYLIRTYTNPGELILDNTMGSGTTLVAAQTEGRRAVGIELSEDYCKIAVERLRQPSFFSIPENGNGAKHEQLELA